MHEIAPAIIGILIFMIPIIAILTKHQREMAELIHGQGDHRNDAASQVLERVASLERQVGELSDLVRRQVIAADSARTPLPPAQAGTDDLASRVSGS